MQAWMQVSRLHSSLESFLSAASADRDGYLQVLHYAAAPLHHRFVLAMFCDTPTGGVGSTDCVSDTSDTPFP